MSDDDTPHPYNIMQTIAASREAGAGFLVADMHLALTMLDRAAHAPDAQTRARNLTNAQRAGETVLHLLGKLNLEDEPRRKIEALLDTVRKRLEALRSTDGSVVSQEMGDSPSSAQEGPASIGVQSEPTTL